MNDCTANDFESKLDEITKYFNTELRRVKTEVQSATETSHLNTIHFNGEVKNVSSYFDAALKNVQAELKSENTFLRKNLDKASKNQENIISKIESLAQSSSQEIENVKTADKELPMYRPTNKRMQTRQ